MKSSVQKGSKIVEYGFYALCGSAGLGLVVLSSNEKLHRKEKQQENLVLKEYRNQQQQSFARGVTTKLTTTTSPNDLLIIANNIKNEYEKRLTDTMDYSLWADNCVFTDSSTSFGGSSGSIDRYKAYNDSMVPYVENPVVKITGLELEKMVTDDVLAATTEEIVEIGARLSPKFYSKTYYVVRIGWEFSCHLKLPWRPVYAIAGITTHYVDPSTHLIVRHEERYTSDHWETFKQLFFPTQS